MFETNRVPEDDCIRLGVLHDTRKESRDTIQPVATHTPETLMEQVTKCFVRLRWRPPSVWAASFAAGIDRLPRETGAVACNNSVVCRYRAVDERFFTTAAPPVLCSGENPQRFKCHQVITKGGHKMTVVKRSNSKENVAIVVIVTMANAAGSKMPPLFIYQGWGGLGLLLLLGSWDESFTQRPIDELQEEIQGAPRLGQSGRRQSATLLLDVDAS